MPEGACGLRTEDLELLRSVLARFPAVTSVKLFGSRAKGTHRNGSDVDLALFGDRSALGHDLLLEISEVLNEETPLPYRFDLVDYAALENEALRDHIDRVGILIHSPSRPQQSP